MKNTIFLGIFLILGLSIMFFSGCSGTPAYSDTEKQDGENQEAISQSTMV